MTQEEYADQNKLPMPTCKGCGKPVEKHSTHDDAGATMRVFKAYCEPCLLALNAPNN